MTPGAMMATSGENKPTATGNASNGWQVIVAGRRQTRQQRRERYSGRHRSRRLIERMRRTPPERGA
jgi:hypothetical protein